MSVETENTEALVHEEISIFISDADWIEVQPNPDLPPFRGLKYTTLDGETNEIKEQTTSLTNIKTGNIHFYGNWGEAILKNPSDEIRDKFKPKPRRKK